VVAGSKDSDMSGDRCGFFQGSRSDDPGAIVYATDKSAEADLLWRKTVIKFLRASSSLAVCFVFGRVVYCTWIDWVGTRFSSKATLFRSLLSMFESSEL
jgi:hypothetical protein